MVYISSLMIPMVVLYIVIQGTGGQTAGFRGFYPGRREGLKTVAGILPTLAGLMIGTGVLRASGFLDVLAELLSRLIPAALLRPRSCR